MIGWTPTQFLREELEDVFVAFDGRIKEHIRQERIWRKHAEFVIAPYADKKLSMLKLWPIAMDDEFTKKAEKITSDRNLEVLRQFREREAKRKLANLGTGN